MRKNNQKLSKNVATLEQRKVIKKYRKFQNVNSTSNAASIYKSHGLAVGDTVTNRSKKPNLHGSSYSKAYSKYNDIKKKKEEKQLNRQAQEKVRAEKQNKRARTHKRLSSRNSKGQPVLKNQIELLLNKIETKQDTYCS